MHSMVIDRRRFLVLAAAAGLPLKGAHAAEGPVFLSARSDAAGQHVFAAFDHQGAKVFEIDLPGRGHGIALSPDKSIAVMMARRPGSFAVAAHLPSGRELGWLTAPPDRHFHGHAAFSGDGRLLFTSENDFENDGRGVIGIWDSATWRRVGEIPSYGIEPHDIRMRPDGRTLVVANGGIRTHPGYGRAKLNIEDMDSSLVHLDSRTGALLGQWRLDESLRLLSMRHLALFGQDGVALACQHQGGEDEAVPLVGFQHGSGALALVDQPADWAGQTANYAGSICVDRSGRLAAASCPRGNRVGFWDTASKRFLGSVKIPDGCGVAAGAGAGEIVMSSGLGGAWTWSESGETAELPGRYLRSGRWDNHLLALL
ncbi:DUF1513 domain-containing protein [Telmatospirillum sp. J64-1]|uniref:DUF1513 domain-containing protein n=1 Tax=Telmatospirillum sp. J64-1 TaxID=2502183 RepID=UPI00115EC28B|nr:DUF1513 domain-containing protein [Telmatospirillum sp. J64-1]